MAKIENPMIVVQSGEGGTYKTSDGWDRPSDWPNLDVLYEAAYNASPEKRFAFITYDIQEAQNYGFPPFSSFHIRWVEAVKIEIGTENNGVFTSIETFNYGDGVHTGSTIFSKALPVNAGRYIVIKVTENGSEIPYRNNDATQLGASNYTDNNGNIFSYASQFIKESYSNGYFVAGPEQKHSYMSKVFFDFGASYSTGETRYVSLINSYPDWNHSYASFSGNKYVFYFNFEGAIISQTSVYWNFGWFKNNPAMRYLSLKNIDGSKTNSNGYGTSFTGNTNLVDFYPLKNIKHSISVSGCNQLSVGSLRRLAGLDETYDGGIIQLAEGETATLTLGATNIAKLSAAEIQAINDKGWTVA